MISPNDIIRFWFSELEPKQWWKKDRQLDQTITQRFSQLHQKASQCELVTWRSSPQGRLAEIIILDQFSRNIYRDSAKAFACDELALALAQEAIALELDRELKQDERSFLYMPYMHSESLVIHDMAMDLFTANGAESSLAFEIKHRDIIARFGRYPHRNVLLSREPTAEELAFLTQPGSSF